MAGSNSGPHNSHSPVAISRKPAWLLRIRTLIPSVAHTPVASHLPTASSKNTDPHGSIVVASMSSVTVDAAACAPLDNLAIAHSPDDYNPAISRVVTPSFSSSESLPKSSIFSAELPSFSSGYAESLQDTNITIELDSASSSALSSPTSFQSMSSRATSDTSELAEIGQACTVSRRVSVPHTIKVVQVLPLSSSGHGPSRGGRKLADGPYDKASSTSTLAPGLANDKDAQEETSQSSGDLENAAMDANETMFTDPLVVTRPLRVVKASTLPRNKPKPTANETTQDQNTEASDCSPEKPLGLHLTQLPVPVVLRQAERTPTAHRKRSGIIQPKLPAGHPPMPKFSASRIDTPVPILRDAAGSPKSTAPSKLTAPFPFSFVAVQPFESPQTVGTRPDDDMSSSTAKNVARSMDMPKTDVGLLIDQALKVLDVPRIHVVQSPQTPSEFGDQTVVPDTPGAGEKSGEDDSEDDIYSSWADYYFDERNFKQRKGSHFVSVPRCLSAVTSSSSSPPVGSGLRVLHCDVLSIES
ncbi:hypothetical protein BROUX41_000022 [Berkeleyomyces rouxiae]|uniref:uncharacterized protein n=1 Tax=Berkeleyomyces rouxiae TaxID=2035830 RepID=UPI003B7D5BA3